MMSFITGSLSSMKILIFGLPSSGKTTLAEALAKEIPCVRFNGDKVRSICNDPILNKYADRHENIEGRLKQARRMFLLSEDIDDSIIVVADFVCPTKKARDIFAADFRIWMNTDKFSPYVETKEIFENPEKSDVDVEVTDWDCLKWVNIIKSKISV